MASRARPEQQLDDGSHGCVQMSYELSVVMPCLNESETIEACILEAQATIERENIDAEIVVADNGSSDGSQELAKALGARVVSVPEQGYGSALRHGIAAARGRYVVLADSDCSYDFGEIGLFLQHLRLGSDLVIGNRFQGGIEKGAMPFLHRWLGNPVLSFLGRFLFGGKVGDFHCGMRGLNRNVFLKLDLEASGMEFASEMVIKMTMFDCKIEEVPIVLRKDKRSRPPHLRTWRDGWRHLRYMLLLSPLWLFTIPGALLFFLGLGGVVWLSGEPRDVGGTVFDIHTLLVSASCMVIGHQATTFGLFAKIRAVTKNLHPNSAWVERLRNGLQLEPWLILGGLLVLMGSYLLFDAFLGWQNTGFSNLDPQRAMREVIPALLGLQLGIQTIFSSFFLSLLPARL